jgi:hypothetical protein
MRDQERLESPLAVLVQVNRAGGLAVVAVGIVLLCIGPALERSSGLLGRETFGAALTAAVWCVVFWRRDVRDPVARATGDPRPLPADALKGGRRRLVGRAVLLGAAGILFVAGVSVAWFVAFGGAASAVAAGIPIGDGALALVAAARISGWERREGVRLWIAVGWPIGSSPGVKETVYVEGVRRSPA